MEDKVFKENVGNLRISEDVIASIAKYAANEVEGVASVGQSSSFMRGLSLKKPISIQLTDDVASIDVYMTVHYGIKITDVAARVQESVKNAVQNMTSVTVSRVNVVITGVSFEDQAV